MENSGKAVIVAALDGTFQRKSFGDILTLVPLCESVIKLTAVCNKCHGDAAFSHRLAQGNEGVEIYDALCRVCYNSHMNT